jgi:hypothetical protein
MHKELGELLSDHWMVGGGGGGGPRDENQIIII